MLAPSSTNPNVPPPGVPDEPLRFSRAQLGWLLGLTVLAAGLRFAGLWHWPLWIDEAHTWRDATMPLDAFLGELRAKYPLPFLLLRGLLALGLPESEGALRLPFAVCGIATVPALAFCGRQIVGARAALFAAGLLAIHPWHVFWSQNARGYVIVVLASVFTVRHVLAYARHDRMRDLLSVGGWILVAAASHATGALLAVGVGSFLLVRRFAWSARTILWLAVVAAVSAYVLPWAIDWSGWYEDFIEQKRSQVSLPHFLQTTGYYFRPGVLVAAAVGLWLLRQVGGRDRAIVLASMSAVPLFVLFVCGANLVLTTARYAICVLPVLALLAAFAAVRVARVALRAAWPTRVAAWAAAVVVPALLVADHALGLVDYYTVQNGQRAHWRAAAGFLRERAGAQPLRVATINYPTMLYYLRPGDWRNQVPPEFARNRVVSIEPWMIGGKDKDEQKLHEPGAKNHVQWHREMAARDGAMLAFVVTLPELMQKDPDHSLRSVLASQFDLVLHLPCWVGPKDESLFVYLPKQP